MDRQCHGRRAAVAERLRGARGAFGAVLSFLLAGCATPTYFTSIWVDGTYSGPPVQPVAVLALFKSEAENRNFETQATQLLMDRGVVAVPGYTLLEPGRQYTQQAMKRQLRHASVGGVLIFRLIGENEEYHYVDPGPYLGPVPPGVIWGDPFYWYYYPNWDLYWHWRSSLWVTRSPGYWDETKYYVIESSLYDNKNDQLLWTAKSKTLDDTQFKKVVDSVAAHVADRLVDLDLLQSHSK